MFAGIRGGFGGTRPGDVVVGPRTPLDTSTTQPNRLLRTPGGLPLFQNRRVPGAGAPGGESPPPVVQSAPLIEGAPVVGDVTMGQAATVGVLALLGAVAAYAVWRRAR